MLHPQGVECADRRLARASPPSHRSVLTAPCRIWEWAGGLGRPCLAFRSRTGLAFTRHGVRTSWEHARTLDIAAQPWAACAARRHVQALSPASTGRRIHLHIRARSRCACADWRDWHAPGRRWDRTGPGLGHRRAAHEEAVHNLSQGVAGGRRRSPSAREMLRAHASRRSDRLCSDTTYYD
ncbi:hypothetical protein PsYK624_151430 [Phanerochaete sordida]|uniref:Uncharacterized protein n=1 Tax=Phanerochaete sordida TaxID=48140 RepID=A0A9P3LKV2_9APHY|nr:hypothetical protein PsYK624_151430 [Phanerochaete sordida]